MGLALEQAELAVAWGQTPFGAVVVDKDGQVIGQGHNTVRADLDPTARVVFAARGTDVPGHKPLLGADFARAAAWVNAQPEWAPVEVVGDFMRERALAIIAAFPWAQARSRAAVKPSR
jgi:tRNA(adenine34) deaminase